MKKKWIALGLAISMQMSLLAGIPTAADESIFEETTETAEVVEQAVDLQSEPMAEQEVFTQDEVQEELELEESIQEDIIQGEQIVEETEEIQDEDAEQKEITLEEESVQEDLAETNVGEYENTEDELFVEETQENETLLSSEETSGTCGNNLTWRLEGKKLIIEGWGQMYNVSPWGNEIEEVAFPEGLTSIGGMAFRDCNNLKSVDIPEGVISIEWEAFCGCSNLKNINIPDSVTSIGWNAFYNTEITEVTIPANVNYIGEDAFGWDSYIIDKNFKIRGYEGSCAQSYAEKSGVEFEKIGSITKKGTCGDNLTWIQEGTKLIISGTGDMYFEKKDCPWDKGITEVILPDGLTSIGDYAFVYCDNLKTISIPTGVKSIGYGAFAYCEKLSEIEIPVGVESIGEWAFGYCKGLQKIIIPDNVTKIQDSAFSHCENLEKVEILGKITKIASCMFHSCSNLKKVNIPNSVTEIESSAFSGCNSLSELVFPDSLNYIEDGAFNSCKDLKEVTFPQSVTYIGDGAFGYCYNLVNVNILNSSCYVEKDAFKGTPWLKEKAEFYIENGTLIDYFGNDKEVHIPDNVTTIGEQCFKDNNSIEKVVIPDGVKNIEKNAFNECKNLSEIDMADSIEYIGNNAFYSCEKLSSVKLSGKLKKIGSDAFNGCKSLVDIIFPTRISSIGNSAFSGCNSLTNIYLPTGIHSIEDGVFSGCSNLIEVTLPTTVNAIGNYVFSGCSSLTTINLPTNLDTIGNNAFYGCYNLKSVTVPSKVSSIGNNALGFFTLDQNGKWEINQKITDFTIYGTAGSEAEKYANANELKFVNVTDPTDTPEISPEPDSSNEDDVYQYKEKTDGTLIITKYLGNESEVNIPDIIQGKVVTAIGNLAFSGCSNLKKVSLSPNIKTIDIKAFNECRNLKSIKINSSLTYIGKDAFKNCINIIVMYGCSNSYVEGYAEKYQNTVYFGEEKIYQDYEYKINQNGEVVITRYVGNAADVIVPDKIGGKLVVSIGDYAFYDNANIKSIKLSGNIVSIGHAAFAENINLLNVKLSDNIKKIEDYVFYRCEKLKEISFPKNLTSIGYAAFSGCDLEMVQFPNSLQSIGDYAFCDCPKLNNIKINKGLKKIGDYAFFTWRGEKCIEIPEENTYFGINIFGEQGYICQIKTPSGSYLTAGNPGSNKDITVYGIKGSSAEKFAKERGLIFQEILRPTATPKPTVTPIPAPATPSLKSVSNTALGQRFTWNAVSGANKYIVYYKTTGNWIKLGETKNIYYDMPAGKLVSGKTYTYTVRAVKGNKTSGYVKVGKKLLYLAVPRLSAVTNGNGYQKITWSKVAGAKGYKVYAKDSKGKWKFLGDATSNSFNSKYVSIGKNSTYTVVAVNGSVKSKYNTKGITKKYVLYAPKLASVNNGKGYQRVTWSKVVGAREYNVYIKSGSKWKYVGKTKATSYNYKSVKKGKTYTYTVVAVNGKNKSGYNKNGIKKKY